MPDRRLVGNALALALWQAGTYLIPLVTYPYLTRTLGVSAYGAFAFSFSLATYGVLVTDWGFGWSATREVAQNRDDPERLTRIFWETIAAKLALAAVALVALLIAAATLAPVRQVAPVLAAASIQILGNVVTVYWCLLGLERIGPFAILSLIGRALVIPFTFLFVHDAGDAWIAAGILASSSVLTGAMSLTLLRRTRLIGRPRLATFDLRGRIASSWHLFVASASSHLYTTSNIVLVGVLLGPASAGIYAAADRLRAAAQNVIGPISQASFPRAAKLMGEDHARGMAFAWKVLAVQVAITSAAALTLAVAAPLIIRVLAGPQFTGSIAVLRLLALPLLLIGVTDTLGSQVMIPLGLQRSFSRIRIQAGLLNLVAVGLLLAVLGVIGAAIGTVVAEVYILFAMVLSLKREGFSLIPGRMASSKGVS